MDHPHIKRQLKKLAGYGWPVFPFEPKLEGFSFDTDSFTLYLSTPTLEDPISSTSTSTRR